MNKVYYPTPEEAVKASSQMDGFQTTAEYCFQVWEQAVQSIQEADSLFAVFVAVHAVFVAGYMAGMRELRARKRKKG